MRKGFLGSLAILAVGAGFTFAQPKGPAAPTGAPMFPGPGGPGGPMGPPMIAPPGFEGMGGPGGPEMMGPPPDGPYGSGGGLFGSGSRRVWGGVDFLYWAPDSMRIPFATVTTSAAIDLGAIGRTTTASIGPGERDITFDSTSGLRAIGGFTIDESGEFGVEGSGFWMETAKRSYEYGANGVGLPVLAVPFVDVTTGAQSSYVVSSPGLNTGGIKIDVSSRVWGLEVNGIYNAYKSEEGPGGLTLLAGPRFLQLREQLDYFTSSTTIIPPGFVPPTTGGVVVANPTSYFPGGGGAFAGAFVGGQPQPWVFTTSDRIRTQNDFYGGQVGFRGDIGYGGAFISLTGKAGAGYMRSFVDLEGGSTFTAVGITSTQPGGLYNQAQQLGRHRRDNFALLGEGGVNVGYQLGTFVRVQAGYSFLWVNNVLRPTRSMSERLVPNQIPNIAPYTGAPGNGIVSPRDITGETDYHLHGFNFGIQVGF